MGKVITQASMSLDGFIADPNDQVGPLFDWYSNGDVQVSGSDPNMVFHTSAASAEYLRKAWSNVAADVNCFARVPKACRSTRRIASVPRPRPMNCGASRPMARRPCARTL